MMTNNIELEELENYNDGESCYIVKNYTAEPSIEDKSIVCNIFIKTLNMPALTEWDDEKKPYISELYIVPRLEFITQKNKDKVFEFSGFDQKFEKEDMHYAQLEFINYGLGMRLCGGMDSYATKQESIDAMKNDVLGISTLIGFFMDKSWNKIGTTCWDTLNELVHNKDQFNESMNRIRTHTEKIN